MEEEINYKSLYEEKYKELELFKQDFEEYQGIGLFRKQQKI